LKKKTTEQFILESKNIHGEKYDYSFTEYINNKSKVKIICPKHGIFEQAPSKHLQKRGCPKCANNIKKTSLEFIKEAKNIHEDKYNYKKTVYENAFKKIVITCNIHGDFKQRPNNHLNDQGCPKCNFTPVKSGMNKKYSKEKLIKIFNSIYHEKYDYTELNYTNYLNKVNVICQKHGKFQTYIKTHMKGIGCLKCNKEKRDEKIIEKFNEIHNNKYIYSEVKYLNNKEKVEIICKKHGSFTQTPSAHLSGQGCPVCQSSSGETKIENILKVFNIHYIKEHSFEDCVYEKKLRFDFYLPKYNICIEYDGKQHFEPIEVFGGVNQYIKTKKRDIIKNKFCRENNIKLIRISFKEKSFIKKIIKYLI
jgi:hypothetical protein